METRPPLPPFSHETATQKVRMAEDAWNTRDPNRVIQVYTEDTRWRNRAEFPVGREQVRQFLGHMPEGERLHHLGHGAHAPTSTP